MADRKRDLENEPTVISKDGLRAASKLGRYTLGKRLGIGGMAEVYLAEQDGPQQFKKRVVIKRILPSLAADPQFVQMFVREAQIAARLHHGNVVQIYELGEHKDGDSTEYFIAMEYLDGLTLQRLANACWDAGKAVPVDVVLRACADACRGLQAAHSLVDEDGRPTPLVHRDISPDNLMITRDGVTKVLDFGIAKGDVGGPKTKTGNVRGKIPYMAPEQVTGRPLDGRADLYALGVSMYFLLCGERPFDRGTDYHTMQAALTEQPKPLRSINPGVPEALETLVLSLLEKRPEQRPSNAADVAEALENMTQGGRKAMIAFVADMMKRSVAAGNPLSEADGAHATHPMAKGRRSSEGDAIVSRAPVAAVSLEGAPASIPGTAALIDAPDDEVLPDATRALIDPALDVAPPEAQKPTPPTSAPLKAEVPDAKPQMKAEQPVAKPEPPAVPPPAAPPPAALGDKHPVVDMLTDRNRGMPSWMALVGVVIGMFVIGGGLALGAMFLWNKFQHGNTTTIADAGVGVATAVDAGTQVIKDAGVVVALPVDAGVVAAATDAGTQIVSTVVDAGVAFKDAGTVVVANPPVVDAGPAIAKPVPKLIVAANAPAGIRWQLPDGRAVGRGSGKLSLPPGTKALEAYDSARQRSDTLSIAVDGRDALKGSVDYSPLLTATLVVKNANGVRVKLGEDVMADGQSLKAVPGTYNLQLWVADKRNIRKITLKKGETLVFDVDKALKK